MNIEHDKSESRGIFKAMDDENKAGEMTYSRSGETMVIEHTEVDPKFQGKGVGKQLVKEAVSFSRENAIKINPECSYAKKVLTRGDEYKDVLV